MHPPTRFLPHEPNRTRRVLDPADVYYFEATGDETVVRLWGRTPFIDVHPLGDLADALHDAWPFYRIHQSWIVNLERLAALRPRGEGSDDWELVMQPPVNRVLPVARLRLGGLMARFEIG